MRIAYLDCASGISGDMTLGALVDAGASLSRIQTGIDSLGLPNCRLETEEVHRHGFRATKLHVRHEPEHAHRHLHHITKMIDESQLTPSERARAHAMFLRLAQAEAHVHGTTVEKVHFHEVGAVDSIADIVGVAIAWEQLQVEKIVCSPVPTGHGFITIAHGRTSVPAPATAELLRGVPIAPSIVEAELTTPTGAAIVATLADEFGPLPPLTIDGIGYGAGDKDFAEQGNILRILIGEIATSNEGRESLVLLETNVDDVTAEVVAYCQERLFEAGGALDVTTTAIQMKKSRSAMMIRVLCRPADESALQGLLFQETGTLGVRHIPCQRTALPRKIAEVSTQWGIVRVKVGTLPTGIDCISPEFEDCRSIARSQDIPLHRVMELVKREAESQIAD